MEEYNGGEFCLSVECPWNETRAAGDKQACKFACIFSAHRLHRWLDENGYKIVKEAE